MGEDGSKLVEKINVSACMTGGGGPGRCVAGLGERPLTLLAASCSSFLVLLSGLGVLEKLVTLS